MEKKPSLFSSFQREIDNEKLERFILDYESSNCETRKSDEENTIVNLDTNLNNFNDKCSVMLNAFDDAFETIYGENEVSIIQVRQLSEELQSNCVQLVNMVKTNKNTEIEQLKCKCTSVENESLTTINNLQFQVTELKMQLREQSTFSSNIGSIFGHYLWKATQIPAVVDIMVLQKDKITNMARLFTSILSSFVETYNNQMPPVKTCETKFVLNILGIVANLTTSKSGCNFFTQTNEGISVIKLIVSLVLCTPKTLRHNIKKIAYAALYNASIQFNGHLIMENNELIKTLYNDLKVTTHKDINDNETFLFPLKLLFSLTRNMNETMCIIVKDEINLQDILNLTRYTETELIARKIYENINFAIEKYNINFE